MLLQDKVIIVTSAGGGIRQGIAQVCTCEGAQVVVADIRAEAAQQVLSTLPASTLLPPSLAPARMKPPSGASLASAKRLPSNWRRRASASMLSRRA